MSNRFSETRVGGDTVGAAPGRGGTTGPELAGAGPEPVGPAGSVAGVNPPRILAVLSLAALSFALLQSMVAPALPTIQHDLGASENGVAWLLTGYLLSAAVATPILGRLGDRHGKRRIMLVSLSGLAIGCLLAALATSLPVMIAGRVIQGVGGGVFPLAFGIIRDEFPAERVPGSIGLVSALLGLGGGIGVVLAGVIVEGLDYHWLFWVPLAMVLVALVVSYLAVPESPRRAPGRINWMGAFLMSVGLVAVLLAVSQTTSWGWISAKTLGVGAFGLIFLYLWVLSDLSSTDPLVDMRMMSIRGVWATNLVAVMIGASMLTGFVLIPQFVQVPPAAGFGFGADVTAAGLFLLPMALVMLVVGALAGRVEARFGSRAAVIAGSAFTTASFVIMLAFHDHRLPIYVASAILGIGIGLAFAAMANLIVQAVPHEQTGVATGMNTVARSLGMAFGGQIAATFIAEHSGPSGLPSVAGFDQAFQLAIVAGILALLAALAVPRRRSGTGAEAVVGPPCDGKENRGDRGFGVARGS
jgi:EmrB/QacA subfamily drug resistance transporter